jgi:ribosome biogenesis GTPase / thiamine phosphate phosphatase
MTIADLGFTGEITDLSGDGFITGRVIREYRERYSVSAGEEEYDCEITGNLRFTASSRSDFPAVGDWVLMIPYDDGMAIIHKVLPRITVLERQAVGKAGEKQIISANIDVALIIQSIDNNFNINRLERYLTICYDSHIEPVLVLSKIDLVTKEETASAIRLIDSREKKIKTIQLSNTSLDGLDQILNLLEKRKTYCVIGSSGVGKSTLINNLLNKNVLKTGEISQSTNKGKHITTHRELFVLDNGSIIIDTPGMKELGMTDNQEGIKTTFDDIYSLSLKCKFPDCTHTRETGCAVMEAVSNGLIDMAALENFRKIQREQQRFQTTIAEKHKKDKMFGKEAKLIMKEKKKNKF